MKIDTEIRIEIIATVDELNQYLNGNVTQEALLNALEDLYITLIKDGVKAGKKW
jgi:hypothetical protein